MVMVWWLWYWHLLGGGGGGGRGGGVGGGGCDAGGGVIIIILALIKVTPGQFYNFPCQTGYSYSYTTFYLIKDIVSIIIRDVVTIIRDIVTIITRDMFWLLDYSGEKFNPIFPGVLGPGNIPAIFWLSMFLSSAYVVSPGPTSQNSFCFCQAQSKLQLSWAELALMSN